ncbi:MAG: hypothetical protein WKF61_00595 [Luteimonas sp.]
MKPLYIFDLATLPPDLQAYVRGLDADAARYRYWRSQHTGVDEFGFGITEADVDAELDDAAIRRDGEGRDMIQRSEVEALAVLAISGPWSIRPSTVTGSTAWFIENPGQIRIACVEDKTTAAFIATACNAARVPDAGPGDE